MLFKSSTDNLALIFPLSCPSIAAFPSPFGIGPDSNTIQKSRGKINRRRYGPLSYHEPQSSTANSAQSTLTPPIPLSHPDMQICIFSAVPATIASERPSCHLNRSSSIRCEWTHVSSTNEKKGIVMNIASDVAARMDEWMSLPSRSIHSGNSCALLECATHPVS